MARLSGIWRDGTSLFNNSVYFTCVLCQFCSFLCNINNANSMFHLGDEKFPVWAYAAIGGSVLLVVLIASSVIVFCRTRKHSKPGKFLKSRN